MNVHGLVLGVQPEGLTPGVFSVLNNTKIYRRGAIGLRDQRDFFAGLDTRFRTIGIFRGSRSPGRTYMNLGRDMWVQHITRFDKDYILAFIGSSLYVWPHPLPDPGFSGSIPAPNVAGAISFENFLPIGQVPTTVSILPADRSLPVTYFVKPGSERMYKILLSRVGRVSGEGVVTNTGEAPQAAYQPRVLFWGINQPTGRPRVSSAGAFPAPAAGQPSKGLTDTQTTKGAMRYDWIYTYANSETGHESNPSAGLEETYHAAAREQVRLEIPIDTGGDPQIDLVRIYRSGGINTQYNRTAEVKLDKAQTIEGVLTIVHIDGKSDSEIALAPEARIDNYVPFVSTNQSGDAVWNATCGFVFGPFADRVILGIGEKNQPGNVFWTNPGRPDSSAPNNNVQVTSSRDPLVSGCVYNGLPYVASRGDWYALDFQVVGSGVVFSPRRTQAGKGPLGPWAVASGDFIYFVTQDGVMLTDGQSPAKSISTDLDPLFHGQGTDEYHPIDFSAAQEMFRLFWAAPELHFIYPDTTGTLRHLIYDGEKWRSESFASPGFFGPVTWAERSIPPLQMTNDEFTPPRSLTDEQYPLPPWEYEPLMHATCIYWDSAWPARSVFIGSDRRALFVQQPYQSSGLEVAYFDYDKSNGDDWRVTSLPGWVVSRFRTHTDDYETPAMLKEVHDVSFEASMLGDEITQDDIDEYGEHAGPFTETGFYGRAKLSLYVNAESGITSVDEVINPSATTTGQPIGSSVYNATTRGRQRFPFRTPEGQEYFYSTAWDFEFVGPWNFHNLSVFWRPDSEVIKLFQQCSLSHGLAGWGHVRDGYIDARFYGPATLTLSVDHEDGGIVEKVDSVTFDPADVEQADGGSLDYTGLRRKWYYSFRPMKGTKFTWTLECPDGMRLYSSGCEANLKQWTTGVGYKRDNPFGPGAQ
jgi:hypothetical protein